MQLNLKGLQDSSAWEKAGVKLPDFDIASMRTATDRSPVWVHFGAGNIFRGFIAVLQQRLLNEGLAQSGIIAAESFDYDIINKIYIPHDCLTLLVGLRPDGGTEKEVIASIAQGICADVNDADEWAKLVSVFENPALRMVSFTITEKGYALTDTQGSLFPAVAEDIKGGPSASRHVMSVLTALLLSRFNAGATPISLVSMDNCSRNGDRLKEGILTIAHGWLSGGFVKDDFVGYIEDDSRVACPWSMIDKITPYPADVIYNQLKDLGISDMEPIVTGKNTSTAPFVNAEIPQYLVLEDKFPNGRPPLEKAGVYFTDRNTVSMTEQMKVTTCLNPLHTALAVYGCMLGYNSIAAEMKDAELKALVERIGFVEGMPVVTDPGIIKPVDFIREVVEQRLPNPFIPDTPQRIATDSSQKVPIRFGETIKSYMSRPGFDVNDLIGIPLALAGWLRYLLAVDDEGADMAVSPDPMLEQLQSSLNGVLFGEPESVEGNLQPILSNAVIFGVDLYEAGLADKVEGLFCELIDGPGAVRKTLKRYLV